MKLAKQPANQPTNQKLDRMADRRTNRRTDPDQPTDKLKHPTGLVTKGPTRSGYLQDTKKILKSRN